MGSRGILGAFKEDFRGEEIVRRFNEDLRVDPSNSNRPTQGPAFQFKRRKNYESNLEQFFVASGTPNGSI